MPRLQASEIRSRLKFDYENASSLRSPHLGPIDGFVSERDYRAGAVATPGEGAAGLVCLYKAHYRFPILIGEGRTTAAVTAKFDLLAGGNYPFTAPTVSCLGSPLPWSPHVHPTSGLVCLGRGWADAHGRMLAAQLIVHVMRLLNCDEPEHGHEYGGWNPAAANYWRNVLKARPLNRDLEYPVLDARMTHGLEDEETLFRSALGEPLRILGGDAFRALAVADDGGFEPVG